MEHCASMDPLAHTFDAVMLLTMGLTISLGHCIGMCGPLVTAFSVSGKARGIGPGKLLARNIVYHLGRICSYASLGIILGWLGETFFVAEGGRSLQGILSLVIATLMLILAANLAGWIPALRWIESGRWGQAVGCRIRDLMDAPNLGHCAALGAANGWLPCGPVLAAGMTAAATGSPWKGALAMLLFGAGTIPVLVLLGMGSGQMGLRLRRFFHTFAAVVLLVISVQLAMRGLAALELVGHFRINEVVFW